MASESSGFIGQVIFGIIALGVAFSVSKAKKAAQAREVQETQAQLKRVDAAIREARLRAARSGGAGAVDGPKASADVRPMEPDAYTIGSPALPAAVPFALPVEAEAPAPPTSRGSEARQESESHSSMVSEPSVAAEAGSPASRPRSVGLQGAAALAAVSGFPFATPAELREAIVWREIFGPCSAMRS